MTKTAFSFALLTSAALALAACGNPSVGAAVCGDGKLGAGELCDGDCPSTCDDGNACTTDSLRGSAANCTASCDHVAISTCKDGDGCCPAGCTSGTDDDCKTTCGNAVVDPGETCDGNCPSTCNDGNACTADAMTGSASSCNAACTNTPITSCTADGCCPAGCNSTNDPDCSASCGNNTIESGETCDGNCPSNCDDANACTTDGMTGSTANCNVACTHTVKVNCVNGDGCCPAGCTVGNDSDCSGFCGDGIVEPGETCDGNCPSTCNDGNSCTRDVMTGLATSCTVACTNTPISTCANGDGCCAPGCTPANDSDCSSSCGNSIVDANETCDGNCPTTCDDSNACTIDLKTGTPQSCNVFCSHQQRTQCASGDGCCPAGCVHATDADCSDGVVPLGGPCTTGADCVSGACLPEESSGWTAGYCSVACKMDVDCGSGAHCGYKNAAGDGKCLKDCMSQNDCRTNYDCFDFDGEGVNECAPSGTGAGAIGSPCAKVADCAGGKNTICLTPSSFDAKDGMCSHYCAGDPDCPMGSHCNTATGLCLKDCTDETQCRSVGYGCFDTNGGVKQCIPTANGAGPVGAACTGYWDCSGGPAGTCVTGSGWPNGYCSVHCNAAGQGCPSGSVCFQLVPGDASGYYCLDTCASANECRAGYQCVNAGDPGTMECIPG